MRTKRMDEEIDYADMLRIDPEALDVEWLEQAGAFMRISRESAQANSRVDKAKEALEVVKAGIDNKIRKRPERYGIEKLTEGALQAAMIQTEKYQEAMAVLLDLKYKAAVLLSAVFAFNQRKSALENLVRLHGQEYFAGPREPRNLGKEHREHLKDMKNERVADRIKERRGTKKGRRTT